MKRYAWLLMLALPAMLLGSRPAAADQTIVVFWPLFYHENQEESSDTGVLDLGLARVFKHERNQEETEMEVGGILFAKLFGIETEEDESEVQVLDLGIAKLLEVEAEGAAGHHTTFLDVPLITVFESEGDEDFSENKVLSLPFIGSLFRNKTEGDKKELELFYFIEMKNY